MIDITANNQWLSCTIRLQQILQMIIQACWLDESLFLTMCDLKPVVLSRLHEAWSINFQNFNPEVLPCIQLAYKTDTEKFMKIFTPICGPIAISAITNHLNILPILKIQMAVEDTVNQKLQKIQLRQNRDRKTQMVVDREYSFHVVITRQCKNKSLSVAARHFPKTKDENWFINLGFKSSNTLICLKRVVVQGTKKIKLSFIAPKRPGILLCI